MTYAKASKVLQDFTGMPLLESLESMPMMMDDLAFEVSDKERIAYHTLMAGFLEMFAPKR